MSKNSFIFKPLPHIEKNRWRKFCLSNDSKRQPRSILPLNMIVSDVVHRRSSNPIQCSCSASSTGGGKTISREVAKLLKIKNIMKRPRPSKPNKIVAMLHEKMSKMYPHNSQQNTNNDSQRLDDSRIPIPADLSTPLRRQCENFSHIYEGHHCNNKNRFLTNDVKSKEQNTIKGLILSPVRQYNDSESSKLRLIDRTLQNRTESLMFSPVRQDKATQTSQQSIIDSPPLLNYQLNNNLRPTLPITDVSSRNLSPDFLQPYEVHYTSSRSITNPKHSNEGFVFNPVIDTSNRFISFEDMMVEFDDTDQDEGFNEWSSDSASCVAESTSSGDGTMVKHTTIEEFAVTFFAESVKKKQYFPPPFEQEE